MVFAIDKAGNPMELEAACILVEEATCMRVGNDIVRLKWMGVVVPDTAWEPRNKMVALEQPIAEVHRAAATGRVHPQAELKSVRWPIITPLHESERHIRSDKSEACTATLLPPRDDGVLDD